MRSPAPSWPSALRATYSPPPRVAPHRPQSAAAAAGLPCRTSGARFCRTLYTASPGAGTPWPQIPILAWPERSMTRLARPWSSGLITWPSCSYPPAPADSLNPPLNAASRRERSAPVMAGPARTSPAAAAPGSPLPLCRTYRTGPEKVARVTRDPSAVRVRVTVTRGVGGAAGAVAAAWLADGAVRGAEAAGTLPVVARVVAPRDPVPWAPAAGPGDELHAVSAHRPASRPAVQSLRIVRSRCLRSARPSREPSTLTWTIPPGRTRAGSPGSIADHAG